MPFAHTAGISAGEMALSRRGAAGDCGGDLGSYMSCDLLALAVAVEPGIVTSSKKVFCEVEVQGSALTRGMSVFDWKGILGKESNTDVVEGLNMKALYELFEKAIDS